MTEHLSYKELRCGSVAVKAQILSECNIEITEQQSHAIVMGMWSAIQHGRKLEECEMQRRLRAEFEKKEAKIT